MNIGKEARPHGNPTEAVRKINEAQQNIPKEGALNTTKGSILGPVLWKILYAKTGTAIRSNFASI